MFNAESAVNVESYFQGEDAEPGLLGCLTHEARTLSNEAELDRMLAAMDAEYARVRRTIERVALEQIEEADAAEESARRARMVQRHQEAADLAAAFASTPGATR